MNSFKSLSVLILAGVLAAPNAAFAQVQVNQTFIPQGPSPSTAILNTVQSGDAFPNGTVTGAIQAVVTDPVDPNTMYIGAPNGGVWVTHNAGASWTPLSDSQATLSISSLSLDPTDPTHRTLLAGTGLTANGSIGSNQSFQGTGRSNGLLYSTDGGTTWSSLGSTTFGTQTVADAVARGSTLVVGTYNLSGYASLGQKTIGALYRSTDGGATFTTISGTAGTGLPNGPISSLVGAPDNPNRLYAAVTTPTLTNPGRASTAIYMSNDAGATWTQIFSSTNTALINTSTQTAIRLSAGAGGVIAAGLIDLSGANKGDAVQVFLSNNSGTTWNAFGGVLPTLNNGNQASPNFAIAVDPNNSNIVFVTGDRIAGNPFTVTAFRLDFTGNTATSLTDGQTGNGSTAHADSRALAFDASGRLIMTSDGGIYARTSPDTSTGVWQQLNNTGLAVFAPYNVAYDANAKRLAAAAQDNGVTIQSARNNPIYNAVEGADGINININDRTLAGQSAYYSNTQQLFNFIRIVRDANGNNVSPNGATFWGNGIPVTCNGGSCPANVSGSWFNSPVILNKIDPTRIAIGGDTAYVTQDTLTGANAPTATSIDLTLTNVGTTGLGTSAITKIAYGTRDNPNVLAVGATTGLFVSTTAGVGSLNPIAGVYTGQAPTGLVFDLRSQNRFYVADNNNLFGTQNQGATIQTLTANLPTGFIRPTGLDFINNNGVDALVVGGLNSVANAQSPIVVADSDGSGNLSNWRFFGQGLPNTQVGALAYNPTVDVLAVGTFGRGLWSLYDVTSYFPQATVLQFGLADNDSMPDASFLTNGTVGNRQLIKYGIGTLTIAGAASYTGGTLINRGALVLGTGGTGGSILGDVTFCTNAGDPNCDPTNNKQLAFNRSDTYTFGGAISGAGEVFQIGSGKTVLTGTSTYTGPTFVDNGTLSVNGSITSSVFVNAGGTLGGNGSVGPTTIFAGGALSPGNSVGTITVNGNLAFNTGALYLVEVFGNTADRTNVTGTATLAGTVAASFTGGNLANSYTILSAAGGRTGTFGSLVPINAPAFITASLAYTSTDVLLNLNSGIAQTPGLTRNQGAVATALDNSFNNGGGTLPGLLGVSAAQLPAAMDALSGEGLSGTQETAFSAANMFNSLMMDQGSFWRNGDLLDFNGVTYGDPMQYAPAKRSKAADHPAFKAIAKAPPIYQPRWRTWVTGFDGTWKLNGETGIGSAPLSHNTAGGAAGLDYQFAPDVLAGFAVGGSSSNFSVPARLTSGHLDGAHFGGYGVKTWGSLYAAGAVSFNTFRDSTSRTIAGVGPTEVATASFDSNLLSGRLEVGSKYAFSWLSVTPFAAVQVSQLWQNGFTEANIAPPGAGVLGLTERSVAVSSVPTFLGVQFDSRYYLPGGTVLSPYTRVSWVHEFNPTRQVTNSFIALPGTLFTVDGPHAARDAAKVEVGGKLAITRSVKAFASFDGEFSNRSQAYAGKGGVIVSW
jgi:autotransporter-associated beta strand protein